MKKDQKKYELIDSSIKSIFQIAVYDNIHIFSKKNHKRNSKRGTIMNKKKAYDSKLI